MVSIMLHNDACPLREPETRDSLDLPPQLEEMKRVQLVAREWWKPKLSTSSAIGRAKMSDHRCLLLPSPETDGRCCCQLASWNTSTTTSQTHPTPPKKKKTSQDKREKNCFSRIKLCLTTVISCLQQAREDPCRDGQTCVTQPYLTFKLQSSATLHHNWNDNFQFH